MQGFGNLKVCSDFGFLHPETAVLVFGFQKTRIIIIFFFSKLKTKIPALVFGSFGFGSFGFGLIFGLLLRRMTT